MASGEDGSAVAAQKSTVLIVDDDPDYLAILRSLLEKRGFRIATALSGQQALDELARERPDVVLLDVVMPDMSGLEVLQRIRETPTTASLPVILVSARAGGDDMLTGYQYGADYYITKPCTPKQLVYGVNLVLGRQSEGDKTQSKPAAPRVSSAS
jgi:DNA-binding response OmpR family regulator